jgi:hypothetical protein
MEIFFPYAQDISMQISRNNVNNLKDLMCIYRNNLKDLMCEVAMLTTRSGCEAKLKEIQKVNMTADNHLVANPSRLLGCGQNMNSMDSPSVICY